MKAFVVRRYGPPEALELADLDRPEPAAGEVLVRVRATSVNPYDWHGLRGEPRVARLMPGLLGLRAPKLPVLGCDVAGRVEAVGTGVTRFRPGDDVYALLEGGGFGEYVSARAELLARMPANVQYEEAAAVPMAAVTALVALRAAGPLEPGREVLVNGASGGVGTFAVQLAAAFGARVTGVCIGRNAELVRSLGADEVIDYTAADFTRDGRRYDLFLDLAGSRSLSACRRVLGHRGAFVAVGGPPGRWLQPAGHVFAALAQGPFVSQRVVLADVVSRTDHAQMLEELAELIGSGKVRPVVARRYPFAELPAAVAEQERGHTAGKVVVTL